MGVSIKKSTVVSLEDSKGNAFKPGDLMLFKANGRAHVGVYTRIASRGALVFVGINELSDCEFHVMPAAIEEIYPFEV